MISPSANMLKVHTCFFIQAAMYGAGCWACKQTYDKPAVGVATSGM